ncbi:MAG TPA: tRNA (guanosine(37)-N1)-methyltransferase TrmD [Gammaproteobacteria bacterium]|nr:tRNA (guanosine(37)-N1)-methyltransferase TrmD [Gammaproteobacteria bacterium]
MWLGLITLFPDMFAALNHGIPARAQKNGLLQLNTWNPRDFATDKHRSVDDHPYGGGPGMVMMTGPLVAAIQAAKTAAPTPPTTIYLSPQGKRFDQAAAEAFAKKEALILVSGRYEGIDERVINTEIDECWSLGDFILSGGELAAMAMIDATTRLLPGALGDADSAANDSLSTGLLEYPQYTRPETFQGQPVPPVLLSGNHAAIARWRLKQSLGRTQLNRPDLLEKRTLSKEEAALLAEFLAENASKPTPR